MLCLPQHWRLVTYLVEVWFSDLVCALDACSSDCLTFCLGDDIFDVRALIDHSNKHVVVSLRYGDQAQKSSGNSKNHAFPANASISRPGSGTLRQSLVVETGSSLSKEFEAKAEYSLNYAGVSLSGNTSYSNKRSFKSDSIYGLWSLDQKTRSVFLDGDQTNNINEAFLQTVRNLPAWDPDDSAVKSQYQSFFHFWGTHFIKECFLGRRYQLRIVNENKSSDTKEKMTSSIEGEYGNIVKTRGGGKSTHESASYMMTCDIKCFVRGGDPNFAMKLADDPQDPVKFNNWVESSQEDATDAIINVRLEDFGTLLKNSSNQDYRRLGQQLSDAFSVLDDTVTIGATLTMNTRRWGLPRRGSFPVDARVWFSVSGPGITIEPVSGQDCTLHEQTTTSFVANHDVSATISRSLPSFVPEYMNSYLSLSMIGNPVLQLLSGLPMSVHLKISGPASAGPIRFYLKTTCGEVSLIGSSQTSTFSIKKPDPDPWSWWPSIEGAVELPNLLVTGDYEAIQN